MLYLTGIDAKHTNEDEIHGSHSRDDRLHGHFNVVGALVLDLSIQDAVSL